MSILRWDPFEELNAMQRAMDRLMQEFGRPAPQRAAGTTQPVVWQPAVEMYETDSEVVVRAELPGIDPKDVDVTVAEGSLVIKAEAKAEQEERGRAYLRREFRYGAFLRSLPLPAEVKGDEARATYKGGILEVRVPKSERVRPRQVKVHVE
ncbi:MAG: Hsp20/alpha crystallin family protein [Armatimonadota bacterium]|nr:Hsp20/alpha crystallin family protein [Armatimonadota bacterium]MDR5697686.1 Hsp20/alpha crystallin family protein [Armatimonadota bacterium]